MFGWLKGNKGAKKDDEAIVLMISEQKLSALHAQYMNELAMQNKRIARIEGTFGDEIKKLMQEVNELEDENEQLESQLTEKITIETQRAQLQAELPTALSQLPLNEEQKKEITAALTLPENQQMIDGVLEKFFPDIPVRSAEIVKLAPAINSFVSAFMSKKQETKVVENQFQSGKVF